MSKGKARRKTCDGCGQPITLNWTGIGYFWKHRNPKARERHDLVLRIKLEAGRTP
jgi:hypothetical protein